MQTREQIKVEITELLDIACEAALKAGQAIMKMYKSETTNLLGVEGFPTTVADRRSHKILEDILCKTGLPVLSEEGLHIDYHERKHWNLFWLVDPLDGTTEFLKKNDEFTVNIALIKKNKPIAGVICVPCGRQMYFGSLQDGVFKTVDGNTTRLKSSQKQPMEQVLQKKEIRMIVSRSHFSEETRWFVQRFNNASLTVRGSAVKFVALLENEADLYPRLSTTMEWDTAAGHALLNAAGKGLYQLDGKTELTYNQPELENPSFLAF